MTGLAPEAVSKQVGQTRSAVDFFVSLMYGQILIALLAVITMGFDDQRRTYLAFGILAAVIIAITAYRGAIAATDEWAYAVQALINAGRNPLAKGLALKLPATLEDEQQMWRSVGRFLGPKPSAERLKALDEYRLTTPEEDSGSVVSAVDNVAARPAPGENRRALWRINRRAIRRMRGDQFSRR